MRITITQIVTRDTMYSGVKSRQESLVGSNDILTVIACVCVLVSDSIVSCLSRDFATLWLQN